MNKWRILLLIVGYSLISFMGINNLSAQSVYPDRVIRLIVPFPTGGVSDSLARVVANKVSKELGQQIIVDNRAGAGGTLGLSLAANAPPDGYTLVLGATSTLSAGPYLYKSLSFDPRKDLIPVAMLATIPNVLVVNTSLPVNDLKELVAYLKANPGKVNYASPGNGNSSHLSGELFKQRFGVDIQHVPYKGDAPAITDLIGGQVQMMFATVATALPNIKSGNLKPIAIAGPSRSAALPNVPTMNELGVKNFNTDAWFGIVAPVGVPQEMVLRLNKEINSAIADPEVNAKLVSLGLRPSIMSLPEFSAYVKSESIKWGELVRLSGATLD